jgi:uncharacterized protein (TIGR02217 family)
MSAFHDVRFPTAIALASKGGPMWQTEILKLASGRERRNARWAGSLRKYDVGSGVKSLAELADLIAFFEARHGELHGFRFRDPLDFSSAPMGSAPTALDQALGTGQAGKTSFDLQKVYSSGAYSFARRISKPVAGTVRVAVDSVVKQVGTQVTVDTLTGELTFLPLHVPLVGQSVTAGFEFDVPVRFAVDHLEVSLTDFKAGHVPSIPIVEIME